MMERYKNIQYISGRDDELDYVFKSRLARPFRSYFQERSLITGNSTGKAASQKIGLEIGGPSRLWASGHFLPIYSAGAQYVDGFNFAGDTVWEGRIQAGPYRCEGHMGRPSIYHGCRRPGNVP
jgi:hypothetical protein